MIFEDLGSLLTNTIFAGLNLQNANNFIELHSANEKYNNKPLVIKTKIVTYPIESFTESLEESVEKMTALLIETMNRDVLDKSVNLFGFLDAVLLRSNAPTDLPGAPIGDYVDDKYTLIKSVPVKTTLAIKIRYTVQ